MDAFAQDLALGPDSASVRYPRRSFDALLNLVRAPSPALLESLQRVGFDVERPLESYPPQVWQAAQDLVRRQLFPDLAPGPGFRALGGLFVEAFAQTVVGRVLAAAAPLLGGDRLMARLPGYLRAGADGLCITIESVRAGVWRVQAEAATCQPEFFCGVVEGVLRVARVPHPSATVLSRGEGGFEVLVCWMVERA